MRTKLITGGAFAAVSATALAAMAIPVAAATAAPRSSLPVITVAMNGKTIKVGGTLQSGGVRIVSTVTHVQAAEPTFVRLDPGVTLAQFFKVVSGPGASDPNNLDGTAAIVVDAAASRGTSSVQADLAPGQYVGLDTQGGNPAKFPFTTFVITKAKSPAKLPTPSATVAAIEFGFRGPAKLHDGELVRFVNHGFLVHMIVAAEAPNLATARKIARLLHQGRDRAAQRLAIGFANFAGPLSHDGGQQFVIHNKPGFWILACFMTTQDGREHVRLGMERIIQIAR